MAIKFATATGNWSNPAIWNGGTFPTSADTVFSNTFTVTIDQNITVISISNAATTGVTAGGTFLCSTSRTINANINVGTVTVLTLSGASVVNINGNFTGSSTTTNLLGVTVNTVYPGVTNIVGSINGGTFASTSSGVLNCAGSGIINVTGDVIANSGIAITFNSSAALNVTGNVFGGIGSTNIGINLATNSVVTINGNVTGGSNVTSTFGLSTTAAGTVIINGSAIGGNAASGVSVLTSSGAGTLRITNALPSANTAVAFAGVNCAAGSDLIDLYIKNLYYGATGACGVLNGIRFDNTTDITINIVKENGTTAVLSDPRNIPGQIPSPADVRKGIIYNSGGLVGTLSMPTPDNVKIGVNTDNTVGTAAMTPADVWDVLVSTLTTSGSVGERLKNSSTVQTTGDQITSLS